LLPPLLLPRFQPQLQPRLAEQPNQELMTALETLWQLLYIERALGAHQAEEEAEVEEVEEGGEAEGRQPPFPHNNLSLSQPPPTYESWGRSPESSKGKERKPTAL